MLINPFLHLGRRGDGPHEETHTDGGRGGGRKEKETEKKNTKPKKVEDAVCMCIYILPESKFKTTKKKQK